MHICIHILDTGNRMVKAWRSRCMGECCQWEKTTNEIVSICDTSHTMKSQSFKKDLHFDGMKDRTELAWAGYI